MKTLSLSLAFVGGLLVGYFGISWTMDRIQSPAPEPNEDMYSGWATVEPGGVLRARIPPGCEISPAAGTMYVVCTTDGTRDEMPSMAFSSDGVTVNVHRWEDLEWEYYDAVVASIEVITPVDHDITINIRP